MTASQFQTQFGKPTVTVGKVGTRLPKLPTPNKVEAEWMLHLGAGCYYEPFTLNLPDGTKYTPDVVRVTYSSREDCSYPTCYEVKGPHEHNDRWKLKFKQARAAFPWMKFIIAKKDKDGNWTTSE